MYINDTHTYIYIRIYTGLLRFTQPRDLCTQIYTLPHYSSCNESNRHTIAWTIASYTVDTLLVLSI